MESEDKILKLINYEATPETKAEAVSYLNKLRNYKKETLKKDVVNIKDDLNNLDLQSQEIAFSNYPAFIKTAESSRQVLKGWNETTKNVESLIEKLPDFSQKCDEFVKITLEINSASRLNSLTMKKQVELLEILELPQLMESSIKEEKYEDALELASYVQKLGSKFENVPVVNNIVKTIEASWNVMITQLLLELRCDLTLPKCLQIIGYLRRMQAFSTAPELKLKFLQTRDIWFKEILAGIPKTDAHQHLTKTIEVTRVNLFNIITQYKALFDDDSSKETNSKMNLIFSSWLHEKIEDFLRTIENDLAQCNNSLSLIDLASIMGQCMYFGVSFSRIGVDFRAQVAPIFLKAFTRYLSTAVIKTTKQFEVDMEHFTLINKDMMTYKRNTKSEDSSEKEVNANAPPENLLDFQPLAVYCNGLLNIFNELRMCAPIAIVQPFILSLEVSLENVAKSVLSLYRSEQQAFGLKEKENFLKMCSCFSFELLPYIQHCVNLIFPPNNKLVHNIESITTMRKEKILEPIEHLIPDQFISLKA